MGTADNSKFMFTRVLAQVAVFLAFLFEEEATKTLTTLPTVFLSMIVGWLGYNRFLELCRQRHELAKRYE
ncbi:MAG: hypothetical protein A2086_03975 [Spirochaetes bacterium GWD1_27_9]|nr:MAG: hypothetical protein A2Z98_03125 [Spirochaetes bacterium GWB1_27_13]OHD45132.1 MAG: hypothetical protein A2086_03975 [Spirochaetes bacterium GWD1_27_9]